MKAKVGDAINADSARIRKKGKKYEKPAIEQFEVENIELMAASLLARSGMGMCKYTFR